MSYYHPPWARYKEVAERNKKPKLTRQEYMERNLRLQYIKIGLVIFAIFIGLANLIWK